MIVNGVKRDISPKAYLRGADLRGADLGGADLGGGYLRGAYLRGAYLRGAYLGGTKEAPERVITRIAGRAMRSDGYEFFMWALEGGAHVIRAGCRTFILNEFKAHVAAAYPGTPKAAETLAILAYLEQTLALEPRA
jgi:uncharacterized protein YjbI with pentapeptide repeats